MIEWIVILLIIFCIVVWHYTQSTTKYNLSQIKEAQIPTNLTTLWEEKNPIVVSEVRSRRIWASDALKQTRFWGAQPIWQQYELNPQHIQPVERSLQTTWSEIRLVERLRNLRTRGREHLDGRCRVHRRRDESGELFTQRMGTA